jgi:hypothetical protein
MPLALLIVLTVVFMSCLAIMASRSLIVLGLELVNQL